MDVTLPNGYVIHGVPDDATKDQIRAKAISSGVATAQDFGLLNTAKQDSERAKVEAELKQAIAEAEAANSHFQVMDSIGNVANAIGGGVRGAGSIGALALWPVDAAVDAIKGDRGPNIASEISGQQPLSRNQERRAAMDDALASLGYDPKSTSYKVGKVAGEVAGTAGAGGVLAKTAQLAGAAPKIAAALESGGFSLGGAPETTTLAGSLGNMALRAGAGGATGATQTFMVDPEHTLTGGILGAALPGATKLAGKTGGLLSDATIGALGMTTGVGGDAIRTAFKSGKDGATAFLDNMRGKVDFGDVVDSAKGGLNKMRIARGDAYKAGMVDVTNDKTVIDFAPINQAMQSVADMGTFKGVQVNPESAGTVQKLQSIVEQWRMLDPAEYHTPEGIDALKRAIGDVRESVAPGTPARRAADEVYHSVKSAVSAQAPVYDSVMKGYQKSSDDIKQIEQALSLGSKAQKDTAVRKLQSLLRNNVQTNYGNRVNLANKLEDAGGVDLFPAIAGQGMNSWMPRGLLGTLEKGASISAAAKLSGGLLAAPMASPRLIGEAAYKLGQLTGMSTKASKKAVDSLLSDPRRLEQASILLQTSPRIGLLEVQRSQQ
jgi:hypothetical protein